MYLDFLSELCSEASQRADFSAEVLSNEKPLKVSDCSFRKIKVQMGFQQKYAMKKAIGPQIPLSTTVLKTLLLSNNTHLRMLTSRQSKT